MKFFKELKHFFSADKSNVKSGINNFKQGFNNIQSSPTRTFDLASASILPHQLDPQFRNDNYDNNMKINNGIQSIPGVNAVNVPGLPSGTDKYKAPGSLPKFKKGGLVRGPKGKPRLAIVHGGEYILPQNAKPTKAQKAIVAKNKKSKK
jgi:hypothetical protein